MSVNQMYCNCLRKLFDKHRNRAYWFPVSSWQRVYTGLISVSYTPYCRYHRYRSRVDMRGTLWLKVCWSECSLVILVLSEFVAWRDKIPIICLNVSDVVPVQTQRALWRNDWRRFIYPRRLNATLRRRTRTSPVRVTAWAPRARASLWAPLNPT